MCRPIAGLINMCPLLADEQDIEKIVLVLSHELTHALVCFHSSLCMCACVCVCVCVHVCMRVYVCAGGHVCVGLVVKLSCRLLYYVGVFPKTDAFLPR